MAVALDLGDERIRLRRQRLSLQGQAGVFSHGRKADVDSTNGIALFQLLGYVGIQHVPGDVAPRFWIVLEVARFETNGT